MLGALLMPPLSPGACCAPPPNVVCPAPGAWASLPPADLPDVEAPLDPVPLARAGLVKETQSKQHTTTSIMIKRETGMAVTTLFSEVLRPKSCYGQLYWLTDN
jgi:hypothetical protein